MRYNLVVDLLSQSRKLTAVDAADRITALLNEHPHLHITGGSMDVLAFKPMPCS